MIPITLLFLVRIITVFGQESTKIRGFAPEQTLKQLEWEKRFKAIPQGRLLREYMYFLTSEPHHLGSPKGKINAEWILGP